MGANAVKSHGTVIKRQAAGTGLFATLGEVTDVTIPPLTRTPIEALSQADNDDYYVVGMRRTGGVSFGVNFNPTLADHDHVGGLIYSWEQGFLDGWEIDYPDTDASSLTFSGYVSGIAVSAPIDGILTAQITVRPTGLKAFAN